MKAKNYSLRCKSSTSLRKPERPHRSLWRDVFNHSSGRPLKDLQIRPLWGVTETLYETCQRCTCYTSMLTGRRFGFEFLLHGKKDLFKNQYLCFGLIFSILWVPLSHDLKSLSRNSKTKESDERQKQPTRDVLRKRCSDNMPQIYRRTPMPNTLHGCSPVNLLPFFRTAFPKNTTEGLLLKRHKELPC